MHQGPFPIPAGLESSVEFWKKVFSEFSSAQMIFFDPLDPSKIYEVQEVGEESRSNEYINGERSRIAAANGVEIERVKSQRGIKERTAAGLKRAGRYLAQIQEIFRERGLPAEISFLPVVESSYDIYARSSVGALGIFQFMPATARQFKMRTGGLIDERRDPLEATRAAAAYLQQAYNLLGSWPLAITSYNFGPAGMARAVAAVGSDNLVDLIQRYEHPHWGFPPKHFYAEFVAAVELGTNIEKYFPGLQLDAPAPMREMELTANSTIASLTSSTGLSRDELLGWNPAVNPQAHLLPAGYRVKLPSERTQAPLVNLVQVSASARSQPQSQVIHHRVKRGETLGQIAKRYGASINNILSANGLRHAKMVKVGTTLRIPTV